VITSAAIALLAIGLLLLGAAARTGVLRPLWRKLAERRRLPMIFQIEAAECSLACLAMVAGYFGKHVGLGGLRVIHPVSLQGLSLRTILHVASLLGLQARAVRCELDALGQVSLPAMLHWNADHFVVLKKVTGRHYIIHDPSRGPMRLGRAELSKHFSGILVEAKPTDHFTPSAGTRRLTLRRLLGRPEGLWKMLGTIFVVSVFLEMLAMTQPLMLRTVIDVGVTGRASEAITNIAGILLLAALLHGAIGILRDMTVLRAGASLSVHIAQRLFRHTLSLPLSFFEKRPVGHTIQRYGTTDEIERFLVSAVPLGLIDGLMTLATLGMIFYLSPALGAFSIGTVLAFLLLQVALYRMARPRQEKLIWAKGEQNGHFIETLRTMLTTKANALESSRFSGWLSLYGPQVKAQKEFAAVEIGYRGIRQVIVGFNLAIFVVLAASRIGEGGISIGTCLAALVYNGQFIGRAQLFVERLLEFRMLGLRLERLEDIVSTPPERSGPADDLEVLAPASGSRPVVLATRRPRGEVTMEGLSFRYSDSHPLVLSEVSFRIAPGELIAVVGNNGAGKTTLLKLLLGLYQPTEGRVLYDGVPLEKLSLIDLRSHLGTVTQDDQLLTGTVAQNIALFDPEMSMDRVIEAAELACAREDIESTPMGYSTRLGDLGSPFSEGQKQKIFLARALYRRPAIIMMDEGTANLDAASEKRILENLATVGATKILIAHREATIRCADRVLMLDGGKSRELLRAPRPASSEDLLALRGGAAATSSRGG
jgi:ATP-binding cassette, subfamily B, bacterial CvaB/MchF/RaxB